MPTFFCALFQITVASLLGVDPSIVAEVCSEWDSCASNDQHDTEDDPGTSSSRSMQVPDFPSVLNSIRMYMLGRRRRSQRTSPSDVARHLVEKGFIPRGHSTRILHAVQSYLGRKGFRLSESWGLAEPRGSKLHRSDYHDDLLFYRAMHPDERLREVFVDECFVHMNLSKPDAAPSRSSVAKVGVLRITAAVRAPSARVEPAFAVAAAAAVATAKGIGIIGSINSSSRAMGLSSSSFGAGAVPNSLSISEYAGTVRNRKDMYSAAEFRKWFEVDLIPNLGEPSLIIMNNAKYHVAPPRDLPRLSRLSLHELRAFLRVNNLEFAESDTIFDLRRAAKRWILENRGVGTAIRAIARRFGHTVLYLPPGHHDLQPMEAVWERLKLNLATRSCSKIHEFRDISIAECNKLLADSSFLQASIDRCNATIESYISIAAPLSVSEEEARAALRSASSSSSSSLVSSAAGAPDKEVASSTGASDKEVGGSSRRARRGGNRLSS